jgi:hypothetical protein
MELRDDDAFWAARRVAAFTDDLIRAAVHTGEFSDPAAEKYLGDMLIKRRDTIARIYLTAVNPIVAPRLDSNTGLRFENAAFAAGVTSGPLTYRALWLRFDNATGETQAIEETESPTSAERMKPGRSWDSNDCPRGCKRSNKLSSPGSRCVGPFGRFRGRLRTELPTNSPPRRAQELVTSSYELIRVSVSGCFVRKFYSLVIAE